MTKIAQENDTLHLLRFPQRGPAATEAPVKEPTHRPPADIPPSKPSKPAVPVEPMPIIPPLERPDECPDTGHPHCPVS